MGHKILQLFVNKQELNNFARDDQMKIALTYNLKFTDSEEEAEFDSPDTIESIEKALQTAGHDVLKIEVTGPASHLSARLEAFSPDLIFNIAEGKKGRSREAFYPALFDELGYPYTGSDAHTLGITLDKWLTKLILNSYGIDSPKGRLITQKEFIELQKTDSLGGFSYPVIVKPNYEGSSKGISEENIVKDSKSIKNIIQKMLESFPQGVIVEEFISGMDISVSYVEGISNAKHNGILQPVEYRFAQQNSIRKVNILDFSAKQDLSSDIQNICPANLPRDVIARLKAITAQIVKIFRIKDMATLDFRIGEDFRIYFLEINALPSLAAYDGLAVSAKQEGLTFQETIHSILSSAAVRWKLLAAQPKVKTNERLRIGFTYNVKRLNQKLVGDIEAEYDSPKTISSIQEALESIGYEVVLLEATGELPNKLFEAKVDLVFNIAEGLSGRNREAQVPALCELCGIPYSGSDSATLALALDKALTKRLLKQHGVLTPEFQVMNTGKEKLLSGLRYPLIVKPVAEGSSKGIVQKCVVDNETDLREKVRFIIEKYRQPALVEEYITGREFTVGLLGDKRPKILPPMEICFKNKSLNRPVYDYEVKQEWEKHVEYLCPAPLSVNEIKNVEKAARETFFALGCRDVARVDLKMNDLGQVYVLEVNPLPGLTPDYSDLVLIAKAAGMDYRTLITEILAGALKRLREKRREELAIKKAQNGKKLEQETTSFSRLIN